MTTARIRIGSALFLVFALAAASAPATAASGGRDRLDLGLRLALDRAAPAAASAAPGEEAARRVTVLLEGNPSPAALRAAGARLRTRAGEVWTADAPLAAVPALARIPGVRRMKLAEPLAFQLDRSIPAVRVDQLRTRDGEAWSGLTGKGVVIGLVDSGLDVDHDDFRKPDGSTRVLYYWDQGDAAGPAPTVQGAALYGTEWTAAQIDAGTIRARDTDGHGTWVAGVAAGDGSGSGVPERRWLYAGVAPEADLVVVQLDIDEGFTDANLIDGANYVFRRAEALGRPAVVNISLARQTGPHDGTDPLDVALDALTGPGRLIAAAAGNDGDDRVHAEIHVPSGGSDSASVEVKPYTATAALDYLEIDCWYRQPDDLAVTVVTPSGKRYGPYFLGDEQSDVKTGDGTLAALHADPDSVGSNLEFTALITDFDPGGAGAAVPPAPGTWRFVFTDRNPGTGDGEVDLWVGAHVPGPMDPTWNNPAYDPSEEIGSPGTATQAITVGAFNTKRYWVGPEGEPEGPDSSRTGIALDPGQLTTLSSRGPTRDGREKPDLVAPGFVIDSSLSGDLDPNLALLIARTVDPDGTHSVVAGTSVAAPHVAGALALVLQGEPGLTPEDARRRIRASGRDDAYTGPVWNPAAGWGKLDAAALVDTTLTPVLLRSLAVTAAPGGGAALAWQATEEDPVARFALESRGPSEAEWRLRDRFPGAGPHRWTDPAAAAGTAYRLTALLRSGETVTWAEAVWAGGTPTPGLALSAARPNPFRDGTEVPFRAGGLPPGTRLRAEVVDVTGRRVARVGEVALSGAGSGVLRWDGRGDDGRPAPAGVYWLRVEAGAATRSVRLIRVQ